MSNCYKISSNLTLEQVRDHLRSRGFDPDRYLFDYDEESGTVYIRLYGPDGRLMGMQEYRPGVKDKAGKDQSKRYYTDVPNPTKKPAVFWGSENIDPDKDYLFIAEGVFDAAPIVSLGEPAIAAIGSDLSGSLIQQLKFFGKKLIGILDNDRAGNPDISQKQYQLRVKHGKLKSVVHMLGGETFTVPDPYNDFGQMYEEDPVEAKSFIDSILQGQGGK
jgi:hypothetical protein